MIKECEDKILKYNTRKRVKEYEDVVIEKFPERLKEFYEELIYRLLKVIGIEQYPKVCQILKRYGKNT